MNVIDDKITMMNIDDLLWHLHWYQCHYQIIYYVLNIIE